MSNQFTAILIGQRNELVRLLAEAKAKNSAVGDTVGPEGHKQLLENIQFAIDHIDSSLRIITDADRT